MLLCSYSSASMVRRADLIVASGRLKSMSFRPVEVDIPFMQPTPPVLIWLPLPHLDSLANAVTPISVQFDFSSSHCSARVVCVLRHCRPQLSQLPGSYCQLHAGNFAVSGLLTVRKIVVSYRVVVFGTIIELDGRDQAKYRTITMHGSTTGNAGMISHHSACCIPRLSRSRKLQIDRKATSSRSRYMPSMKG
jgi:hypothetical protein